MRNPAILRKKGGRICLQSAMRNGKQVHIYMEKLLKIVDNAGRNWKRQWNRWLFTAMAAAGILAFTWYAGNWARLYFGSAGQTAADIMAQLDFQEKECSLSVEYDCTKAVRTEEQQWALLLEIAEKLELQAPFEKQEVSTEAGTSFALVKSGANSEVILKMVTLFGTEKESEEPIQYLFLNIYLSGNYEDAVYYQKRLQQVLREEEMPAEVKAEFKGVLSMDKKEALKSWQQDLLKMFGAKIVAENDSGSTDIIYAYSPMIANVIKTGKGDVNLNIIVKRMAELRRLEVRVAIPAVFTMKDQSGG